MDEEIPECLISISDGRGAFIGAGTSLSVSPRCDELCDLLVECMIKPLSGHSRRPSHLICEDLSLRYTILSVVSLHITLCFYFVILSFETILNLEFQKRR